MVDVAGPPASALSVPHGGVLVDRLLDPQAASRRTATAAGAPRIRLDARQASDVHCIAIGAFSPLTGFMGSADHASVCASMRLVSGAVWTLPVVLAVDEAVARACRPGQTVALDDPAGEPLALLEVDEVHEVDVEAEVEAVFGTGDPAHPGVAARLEQGPHCVAGAVWALRLPHSAFPDHDLTPRDTRRRFAQLGWRSVVAFQTRNPVHRAH